MDTRQGITDLETQADNCFNTAAVLSTVVLNADERSEVAAVRYDVNVLGTKGPRRMTAIVPAIDADSGRPVGHAPSIHADNGIMDRQAPRRSASMHCMAASVVSS